MQIVDPGNPMPKYLQISAWLRELIETGRYNIGEKLPSETKLALTCNVNRNTLRQALAELVASGLLRKEKGLGTYVASHKSTPFKHKLDHITSYSANLSDAGMNSNVKVLHKGIEAASEMVAKKLFLRKQEQVIAVRRLIYGDDIALIYEETYLPRHKFSDILNMDLTGSMYQIYSEVYLIELIRSGQSIRAVNLAPEIASLFDLQSGAAGLYMESITYNQNNMPIEVLCSYFRGDKSVFEVELGRYHLRNA